MRYFSPDLDISTFNRLFTQIYVQNVLHTFPPSNQAQKVKNRNDSRILSKILRYFSPVLDIATIKRPPHTILRAERSPHVFQRRNKPRNYKIAIIRRF